MTFAMSLRVAHSWSLRKYTADAWRSQLNIAEKNGIQSQAWSTHRLREDPTFPCATVDKYFTRHRRLKQNKARNILLRKLAGSIWGAQASCSSGT